MAELSDKMAGALLHAPEATDGNFYLSAGLDELTRRALVRRGYAAGGCLTADGLAKRKELLGK